MPYNVFSTETRDKIWLMYLRKSRQDDPNQSAEEVLAKHESILQDWARRELGHEIPEDCIYREIVSGGESIEDREEIQKVLSRIEDPNVAGVLCFDPQRLSRGSLTDCDLLIDAFRYSKTLVVTRAMTYDLENKMQRRMFQDELMRGRDYLDYVKEVLYIGRCQSALKGCFVPSRPPYGYDKVKIGKDWTLVPNENADIVRMIFNWYVVDCLTPGDIQKKLTQLSIPAPSGVKWKKESILVMLKNIHYDGKIVFGRKKQTVVFENGKKVVKQIKQKPEDMLIADGRHQAIVDHEIFEQAQERIEGRGYLAPKTDRDLANVLAGILKCKTCGYVMIYHTRENGGSYSCPNRCCKSVMHRHLISTIKTGLLMEHLPYLEEKQQNGDGQSITIQQQIIAKLEKQMLDYKAQEAKQYDLLETGMYTNEVFTERNTALREKMSRCAEQLAEAKSNLPKAIDYESKIVTLKQAVETLEDDTATLRQKNRLLKAIVKEMYYESSKDQPKNINDYTLSIRLNI